MAFPSTLPSAFAAGLWAALDAAGTGDLSAEWLSALAEGDGEGAAFADDGRAVVPATRPVVSRDASGVAGHGLSSSSAAGAASGLPSIAADAGAVPAADRLADVARFALGRPQRGVS